METILWSNAHLNMGFEEMTIEVSPIPNGTLFHYFGIDGKEFSSYDHETEIPISFDIICQVISKMNTNEVLINEILDKMNVSIKRGVIYPEDVNWESYL